MRCSYEVYFSCSCRIVLHSIQIFALVDLLISPAVLPVMLFCMYRLVNIVLLYEINIYIYSVQARHQVGITYAL
jgi:hypothetical protein